MQNNEVNEFLKDLSPANQEAFKEETQQPEKVEAPVEDPEKEEQDKPRRNRRERRSYERFLEEQLQQANEKLINLADRALTNKTPVSSDVPAEWIALYGDTEQSRNAWNIQQQMNQRVIEDAQRAAEERFAELQSQDSKEQVGYEHFIDDQLETLEDEYGIDLTSRKAKPVREAFLDLVGQLSPKDKEGNLTGYADFTSAFELFQKTRADKPDATRQKELASRSMQQPTSTRNVSKEQDEALGKYLKEQGII